MFRIFKISLLNGVAIAAAALILLPINLHAQGAASPSPSATPTADVNGQLQKVTVTGYIVPHVGDGPQPVTTLTQDYIDKSGTQSVSDLLLRVAFSGRQL